MPKRAVPAGKEGVRNRQKIAFLSRFEGFGMKF